MKKLLILLFSILISLNSYGEWINHSSDTDGNDFYLMILDENIDNLVENGLVEAIPDSTEPEPPLAT